MADISFLTKEAQFLLTALFNEYINRRKHKVLRERATYFNDSDSVHQSFMPEWLLEDVIEVLFELDKHSLIRCLHADNKQLNIHLTTEAISILEETYADKFNNLLDIMTRLKGSIPFL